MPEKIDPRIAMLNLKLVVHEGSILTFDEYLRTLMFKSMEESKQKLDKKIRKIKKKVKTDASQEEKELTELEKMDKKRDKLCDLGKEMMKKRKKK